LHEHEHGQEQPTFHGMVLFGERVTYLSHLSMFMSPHDYQAIFEVTLSKEGADPLAAYVEDRRKNVVRPHPESKMYGFQPIINPADDDPLTDAFVLAELVTPADPREPDSPRVRNAFKGNIYRGHFENFHVHEKEGPRILDDVVAHVTSAVVFRKFDPHARELPQLEYFLFGKGQELFLAHVITRPRDFDQIVGVQVEGHQFTDDELGRGVLMTCPGRANTVERKIDEQEEVTGQVQVPAQRPDGPHSVEVRLKAGTQFYFETDDLESQM
jgi:hypothetical protein